MEIMFNDLTHEAQKRLLKEAGITSPEEMNWDIIPVAVIEFWDEGYGPEEDDFTDDINVLLFFNPLYNIGGL